MQDGIAFDGVLGGVRLARTERHAAAPRCHSAFVFSNVIGWHIASHAPCECARDERTARQRTGLDWTGLGRSGYTEGGGWSLLTQQVPATWDGSALDFLQEALKRPMGGDGWDEWGGWALGRVGVVLAKMLTARAGQIATGDDGDESQSFAGKKRSCLWLAGILLCIVVLCNSHGQL
jgi:hypothetical protein